jgi:hypothetical protein
MKLVSIKGNFAIDTTFNYYAGDDIKEDEMAHSGCCGGKTHTEF